MADLSVPWRRDKLRLSLPSRWVLQQVARSQMSDAPANWPQRLAAVLAQPGTGQSLARLLRAHPRGRVAVVVEDVTRGGPLATILDRLLRETRFAGIADDHIEIVFATGMHPPMLPAQVEAALGPISHAVKWRCNDSRNDDAHVSIARIGKVDVRIDRGVAQADLRIIVSSVSPHFQTGFGGGYRLLVPGCAAIQTIRQINRLGMDRQGRQLVGTEAEDNPVRATIDAVGALLDQSTGRSFAIQYLPDREGQPANIAAGQMVPTQRMLAKQCAVAYGVVMTASADVLITNAYPRNFDLCQSLKSVANTRLAVRANGVVLCLADTDIGLRDIRIPAWPLNPTWTRRLVRLVGPEAICSLARRLVPGLARDADPYFLLAARILYRNPIVMYAPALHKAGLRLPGIHVVGDLQDAYAVVEAIIPARSPRVIAFPAGGAAFPVLTGVVGPGLAEE